MHARIYSPDTGEEIHVGDVAPSRNGMLYGKVDVLTCRGTTLGLFHEVCDLVNNSLFEFLDDVQEKIDQLGFMVEGLEGSDAPQRCHDLVLINGDDIYFRVGSPSPLQTD